MPRSATKSDSCEPVLLDDEHRGTDGGGPGDGTRSRFVTLLCRLFRDWESETCETSEDNE